MALESGGGGVSNPTWVPYTTYVVVVVQMDFVLYKITEKTTTLEHTLRLFDNASCPPPPPAEPSITLTDLIGDHPGDEN